MEAYFDPDLKKKNNEFCQIGFRDGNLKVTFNGTEKNLWNSYIIGGYNYKIDEQTLEISLWSQFLLDLYASEDLT